MVRRPALTVSAAEMLEADGYVLGSPANLGTSTAHQARLRLSATTSCLDTSRGRPFGVYLHGNEGTEGAERAVDCITTGWAG